MSIILSILLAFAFTLESYGVVYMLHHIIVFPAPDQPTENQPEYTHTHTHMPLFAHDACLPAF